MKDGAYPLLVINEDIVQTPNNSCVRFKNVPREVRS